MDLLQGQGSNELFKAQSHLYKHGLNYLSSMSLNCAVQLGIPDIINHHGRPITLPELVSALEINPTKTSFLRRLMRLLIHQGLFTLAKVGQNIQEVEEAYDLTPSSRLLVKEKLPCLTPIVKAMLHPAVVNPLRFLGDWLLEEKVLTPFEAAHGMSLWDYMDNNSKFHNLFNEAMASDSEMLSLVVKDCKQIFEGISSLVDVGGGTGTICNILSEAFPHLKCTVLDLPHVVATFSESPNLKFIAGDMFQSIPPADATLLKLVLHDWTDENCLKILRNCRGAITSNGEGKVIIIDIVLDLDKDEHELTEAKLYQDLTMMTLVAGRERSEKEWEKLFLEAGFSHYKITPLFGLRSLIEVFP